MTIKLLNGDCRDVLPTLEAESFDCIVASPPYFGLRSRLIAIFNMIVLPAIPPCSLR